jgi:hypothetical protein
MQDDLGLRGHPKARHSTTLLITYAEVTAVVLGNTRIGGRF